MALPVGLYARISEDPNREEAGVRRQLDDGHALAGVRRWRVHKSYEDNDLSAYQRHVVRPHFEEMLTDLRAGVIRGVIAYDQDRLFRRPADLERMIEIFEDHPDYVYATLQGDIDLSSSDGRTMARVMVAFANKSSSDTGRRVKRKQLELAQQGKPHGGRQPYGWLPDGSVDPDAKKEILNAHKAILGGARIADIHRDWLERGVAPTSRSGKRFHGAEKLHHKTVKRVLTNPALAGIKVYRGDIVRGEDGSPVKAAWKALVTPDRLTEVCTALEAQRPRRDRPGTNALRYLLSGIARCGHCQSPMRGQMRRRASGTQYPVYLCDKSGYAGGCGKIARMATPVDELIIELVLADQQRVMNAERRPNGWSEDDQARLDQALADIAELRQAYAERRISMTSLLELMGDLERTRDGLVTRRAQATRANRRAEVIEHNRDAFDALPLERQRALILRSLTAVIVHPQGKGVAKFNPDLIEPIWAP